MPYKRGAPAGNQNRLRHGRYAKTTVSLRRACRRTILEAQAALAEARTLGHLIATLEGIEAMAGTAPPEPLARLARAFEAALLALERGDVRDATLKPAPKPRLVVNNPPTDQSPSRAAPPPLSRPAPSARASTARRRGSAASRG